MQSTTRSVLHAGSGGLIVEAECHLSNGLPGIVIVGLGNKAVDEARERVRSAFASCGLVMPRKRITINLAPADVPKDSTSLDICIAIAILRADGQVPSSPATNGAFVGELALDGTIRSVRGVIGKVVVGVEHGINTFFVPPSNLAQALLVPGVVLHAPASLRELVEGLRGTTQLDSHLSDAYKPTTLTQASPRPFQNIAGQETAKRALAVAAAGGHNIFLNGPPGTGKSMLAKSLPSLLPSLSRSEMLEVTHLHSLAGSEYEQLVTTRPFRAPHHSTSHVAMVGGGARLKPGEVSLSHHGVLFLDEMPEFGRQTIEALRQPLEDGVITIARAKDTATYAARFILVSTANPCPCGYFGTSQPCVCPAYRIEQYRQRLSGPIMDRIDLYVTVEEIKHEQLLATTSNNKSAALLLNAISAARNMQRKRYGSDQLNAYMDNAAIRQHARLQPAGIDLLNQAAGRLKLSARSYMRVIKVARTIADLVQSVDITTAHVSEALQYRSPTRHPLE